MEFKSLLFSSRAILLKGGKFILRSLEIESGEMMRVVVDEEKARWIAVTLGLIGLMVLMVGPGFLCVSGTVLETEIWIIGILIGMLGWYFYVNNINELHSERLQKLEKEMNELREKVEIQKKE
jgi:putative Mn2+ efflux pump MntP